MTTLTPTASNRRIPTSVRFTEEEAELVRLAATRRGLSVSEYLREVATRASRPNPGAAVETARTASTQFSGLETPMNAYSGQWSVTTDEEVNTTLPV